MEGDITPEQEISLIAFTTALEAEAEPWQGKLAVAWAQVNRKEKWGQTVPHVVFARNQFECWSDEKYRRLMIISDAVMAQADQVARAAYFHQLPDPTNGSVYYLNKDLVIQRAGHLPTWWANVVETVKIGQHQFARDN